MSETREQLQTAQEQLQKLQKEGEWSVAATEARLAAKSVADRSVYLKKLGERWVLEHKQSP